MPDHVADDPLDSPTDGPRPEPVLDQARVVATTAGVLAGASTIAVVLGVLPRADADTLTTALVAAVGAAVTLVNIAVPLWRARIARARVTPLAAPVTASGEPLIAVTALAAIADAKAAAQVPEPGEPVPTPWDEDSTVIGPVRVP